MALLTGFVNASATTTLVAVAFLYFCLLCFYRLYFHPLAEYPGPFLARVSDFYSAWRSYKQDSHIDVLLCHQKYGDIVRYGPNKLIFNSANGFRDIHGHGKNITKANAYLAMRGRNHVASVLSSWDKKEHARKRRYIRQGFTDFAVRGYEAAIKSNIHTLRDQLLLGNEPAHGDATGQWSSPRDMTHLVKWFSFDVMTEVVFSNKMHLMTSPETRPVVHNIARMMDRVAVTAQIPWVREWAPWNLDRLLIMPSSVLNTFKFHNKASEMASGRVKRTESDLKDVYKNVLDAKDPETGESLQTPELLAETGVLIVAGSDTTSAALAATFFYLSRNRKVYDKLAQEVRTTFESAEVIQSGATLRSCTYLAACIDESLRLGPPVAAVPWRVADTGGASIDGQQIPEGTWVGTSLYALHRNSDYFDGPHEFRPERWIASETNTPEQIEESRKVFAPFLIGARMCAAKNMAMTELLLTMAEILYTTDFKPADGPEGHIGEGAPGHGVGRERKEEFQIRSQFVTVDHDGPVLQFRHR